MKIAWMFIFSLILASCSSKQIQQAPPIENAQWTSRIKFTNTQDGGLQTASIDILGEKRGFMRLEISALLGVPVASFVLSSEEFKCALHQEKKFYTGSAFANLQDVLKIPVTPQILKAMVFELPLRGADWKCKVDNGLVQNCLSDRGKISIEWKRQGNNKNVLVKGPDFMIDWFFDTPQRKTQFEQKAFKLDPMRGYKIIQL